MSQNPSPRRRPPLSRLVLGAAVPVVALTAGATAIRNVAADPTATTGTTTPPAGDAADAAAATPAQDPPAGVPTAAIAPPPTAPATDRASVAVKPPTNGQTDAGENASCTLIMPANPLSAEGLATPYQLVATTPDAGPCREANPNQSAFVQSAVITAQGRISLYNPLVITKGTKPAARPVPAVVSAGSTVGIWFGFNGDTLTLQPSPGESLARSNCVNGVEGSPFGQFAYCNAPEFFRTANSAIKAGQLRIPSLGTARDRLPCPTVRDFSVVDQDQSDNVNTHYVAARDGTTAQPGAAIRLRRTGTDLANGSDNRLLTEFVLPALGCRSFTRPDQSGAGRLAASLPLQELQAAAGQQAPIALVPPNNPMTTVNGNESAEKTNLFRAGVNQPLLGGQDNGDPTAYCRSLFEDPRGIQRAFTARRIFARGTSPNPAAATNLFAFLAARASAAYGILGCENLLNHPNPIKLIMAGDTVADASIATGTATAQATARPSNR